LEWDANEIAKQITLIDFNLFKNIHKKEFYNKKNENFLKKMTKRFNDLASWIVKEVLSHESNNDKTKVIEKTISICRELREMKNYQSCNAVLAGLTSQSIIRLKRIWSSVKGFFFFFNFF
jgi:cysteinyl-tRNA synthetase